MIDPNAPLCPGEISNIWKAFVFLWRDECFTKIEHAVAKVNWFKEHGDKWHFGQNSNWETNEVPWSYASFIPLKILPASVHAVLSKSTFLLQDKKLLMCW